MAHEVENMFSVSETPWHGLGKVLGGAPSPSEAIQLAGAAFTMSKMALQTIDGVDVPDNYAIVRDDTGEVLGVVGSSYVITQPAIAFSFFDEIVANGKVTIETGGVLQGGRKIWCLGKLSEAEVVKGDSVRGYLLFAKGTVGNLSHLIKCCATRVVCGNTLSVSLGEGGSEIKVKHTRSAPERLDASSDALANAEQGFAESIEKFKYLATKQVNPEAYFQALYPSKENAKRDRAGKIRERMLDSYDSAPGSSVARGSAWHAYNAATHHLTHHNGTTDEKRTESLYFGSRGNKIEEAYELAVLMADGSTEYMSATRAVETGVDEAQVGRSIMADMFGD